MTDVIRQLASDRKLLAACRQVAEDIAADAARLDPRGDYRVTTGRLVVNGLDRGVAMITDHGPNAGEREFGDSKDGATRALGRASGLQ